MGSLARPWPDRASGDCLGINWCLCIQLFEVQRTNATAGGRGLLWTILRFTRTAGFRQLSARVNALYDRYRILLLLYSCKL